MEYQSKGRPWFTVSFTSLVKKSWKIAAGRCMITTGVAMGILLFMLATGLSVSEAFISLGALIVVSALIIGGLLLLND